MVVLEFPFLLRAGKGIIEAAMNRTLLRIAGAGAVLLFAAIVLHSFRGAAPASPAAPTRLELPEPAPRPAPAAPPRAPAPGRPAAEASRLLPFLEKLGRARLVRDRRTLAALRAALPPVFEQDFEWIRARLRGELLAAAGAVELIGAFGRQDGVGDLAAIVSGPASPLLKDLAIETLGSLGGDAAAAALLGALRNDPDEGLRARAASALGGFPGPEALAVLAAALKDPSSIVRSAASAALSRLPSREAVDRLLWAMAGESDPRLQADFAVAAYAAGGEARRDEVLQAIYARPELLAVLQERRRTFDDSRYGRSWPRSFFEPGQPPVPRPPGGRRIGITVETGPGVTLPEVAARLFAAAPLDRYRDWFRLRRAEEFPSARAYDAAGASVGDVPYDDLDGSVFLRYRDPKSFEPGVLGFTKGCEAVVSDVSLLHEFGHAFAHLGDEYPDGSSFDAANLARTLPATWEPLIQSSTLTEPLRRDKAFFVPSGDCHMANRSSPTRFCPVCQLEIHARLAERAGVPLPW
jgi:hypothetical protein